jgi:hypothetical protein
MRNSHFFKSLIGALLLFSSHLMAQKRTTVSISGGQFLKNPATNTVSGSLFSNSETEQTSLFAPQITFRIEYRVLKQLSVGLGYHSISSVGERTTTNRDFFIFNNGGTPNPPIITKQKVNSKMGGISLDLKGFLYATPMVDIYADLAVGLLANDESTELINTTGNANNAFSFNSSNPLVNMFNFNLGMRYFAAADLAIFGEIGTARVGINSGALAQIGAIFRF